MLDPQGRPVRNDICDSRMMRRPNFQFQWSLDRFEYSTDQSVTRVGSLDEDDHSDFRVLSDFVWGFP